MHPKMTRVSISILLLAAIAAAPSAQSAKAARPAASLPPLIDRELIFGNPEIKTEKIERVMEKEFPLVAYDTPVEKLGTLINKENGAVIAKDESGNYHIVTKYDVIQALA